MAELFDSAKLNEETRTVQECGDSNAITLINFICRNWNVCFDLFRNGLWSGNHDQLEIFVTVDRTVNDRVCVEQNH